MISVEFKKIDGDLSLRVNSWTLSNLKNRLALIYIFTAAAPALYIAPVLLFLMLVAASVELVSGVSPTGRSMAAKVTSCLWCYLVASAFVSGVSLSELFSFQAIRYDANVFYSTLPLLVLGSGRLNIATVDGWLGVCGLVGSILYILSFLFAVPVFESHNAAGGYFMVLLAFFIGRALTDGLKGRFIPITFVTCSLIMSDSRGSILAVALTAFSIIAHMRFPKIVRCLALIGMVSMFLTLYFAYSWWLSNGSVYLYDYSDYGAVAEGVNLDEVQFGERPGTVMHRLLFLFPMAIDLFLTSPFFGIGFTRFNDSPFLFSGISGVLSFNFSSSVEFSNLHAHNSYLHVLAETGVCGLLLYLILFRSVLTQFVNRGRHLTVAMLMLGSLVVASFTEHRLTTPSQAAPLLIIICLLRSCNESVIKNFSRAER